jgi:radical SAM protein with 4Fe4S-binding SPASM domain
VQAAAKQFARKAGWRIYHAVHTHGWMADLVYWGAFYVENFWRGLRFKRLSQNRITPEELFAHRHLEPSSTLVTGVTNICNAKCTFCAYPKVVANKTLQTGVMPLEVFKKAVDEWAAAGGRSLDLTPVVGDPLVDPGLLDKVDYAVNHARLPNVCLTTNAILLDKHNAYRRLVDLGVSVFISTQGTSKEVYEKIYGVKQYDEAMGNIRRLLEYNRSQGEPSHIVIRFRNHEKPSQIIRSRDFREIIKPHLSEKVRINFTVDYDNWGGTIKPEDMSGFMRMRKLPPPLAVPCKNLFNFAVRHDGRVRLCGCRLTRNDNDDLVVGNIREKTLDEISKSDEAWNIIKGFYSGQRPETCMECTFYHPIDRHWFAERAATPAAAPAQKPAIPSTA